MTRQIKSLELEHVKIVVKDLEWAVIAESEPEDALRKLGRPVAQKDGGRWTKQYSNYKFPRGSFELVVQGFQDLGATDYSTPPSSLPFWFFRD